MPEKRSDNKVGYGSPPKKYRFKKGKSGNPKGRPKRLRNFRTDLFEVLQAPVSVNDGGTKRKTSTQLATLMRLREKALKGDARALEKLVELIIRYNDKAESPDKDQPLNEEDQGIIDNFLARRGTSAAATVKRPKSRRQRRKSK